MPRSTMIFGRGFDPLNPNHILKALRETADMLENAVTMESDYDRYFEIRGRQGSVCTRLRTLARHTEDLSREEPPPLPDNVEPIPVIEQRRLRNIEATRMDTEDKTSDESGEHKKHFRQYDVQIEATIRITETTPDQDSE